MLVLENESQLASHKPLQFLLMDSSIQIQIARVIQNFANAGVGKNSACNEVTS